MSFAYIYNCPNCGEIINVRINEEINIEKDKIYEFPVCSVCNHEVTQIKDNKGRPKFRPLTDEEIAWGHLVPDNDDWMDI